MNDAPGTPAPVPAARPARHVPLVWQLAVGFFGPGVVAMLLWFAALAVTHGMKSGVARAGVDAIAVALTLTLWVTLFRLSGRTGWRGVRVGLFLLLAVGVAWVAGCVVIARHLLH